ncbi:hypothetical protein MY4038_004517 [Beauveria bassiana]
MGPLTTTLAVLLAGASTASGTVFSLTETYDVTNFFEKFEFFESKFGTDNSNAQDPNGGFVNYKSRDAAIASGLVSNDTGDNDYTKGLFIARFNHLPKTACGAWPAFWTYSKVGKWPVGGEIDIYENWNLATYNRPTVHTGDMDVVGRCKMESAGVTGSLLRSDCSHEQYNLGCNAMDTKGPWGSSAGGVYAMEWTDRYIRIFTWAPADAPSNIDSAHPDTAAWGKPVMELRDGPCNLKRQFAPQKLILNIDFCGSAAGQPSIWGEECQALTGETECYDYVRNNPGAYKDVYWRVKDIRYFEEGSKPDPTSSSTTTTSTSSTTSVTTSSSVSSSAKSTLASNSSSSGPSSSFNSSSNTVPTSLSSVISSVATFFPNSSVTSTSSSAVSITAGRSSSSGSSAHLTTSSQEWTTSTVYTTRTYTITSCAPTVTNCPGKGHVVTETIPLYTTVCPVTPTATATATSSQSVSVPGQPETSITKVTKTYTITSCAPTVTNCPVGRVTTEVVTSTICPECTANNTKKPSTSAADTGCHGDNCASGVALLIEQSASVIAPSSVATTSSSIQQLPSTSVSTGKSGAVTSAPSRVASTGIASSSAHQPTANKPTGTQSQVPVTARASPSKSVSKAVALLAGTLFAALFL